MNLKQSFKFIKNLKKYLEIHHQHATEIAVGLQAEVEDFIEILVYQDML
jgi:hypothetical protein